MYTPQYLQYFIFPPLPDELLNSINKNLEDYTKRVAGAKNPDTYWWSDDFNTEINQWCQKYICQEMYFGFQIATGNMVPHKDACTKTKINYVIDTGGSNVLTEFFDDDFTTKLASYCIEPHRWHIFKADTAHQVINVEPGKVRFSITGRIF